MRLTSMQFDGDGGYDTPMNAGATANSAVQDSDDGAARRAAAAGRESSAAKTATAMTPTPGIDADDAHKGMMARSNAMSPMTQAEPAAKAKTPKAIDKSAWDRGTKVSQKMVDYVKGEGRGNMGAVPQGKVKNGAPGYNGSTFDQKAPVGAEYKEAVKRIYPNGAPAAKATAKPADKPTNGFSGKGAFPKIAAPKTPIETVKKLRNAEISEANNKGTALNDRVAYNIINAGKEGLSAYGAGTQKFAQIPGTQTKTAKAQAAAKAERAASVAAAKKK